MHADHNRPGLARRVPVLQAKPGAVEADEGVIQQLGPVEAGLRPPRLLGQRRAGREQEDRQDQGSSPHAASISPTRALRYGTTSSSNQGFFLSQAVLRQEGWGSGIAPPGR